MRTTEVTGFLLSWSGFGIEIIFDLLFHMQSGLEFFFSFFIQCNTGLTLKNNDDV